MTGEIRERLRLQIRQEVEEIEAMCKAKFERKLAKL